MAPLDFLVIGAQKCATTWLHECLREHPELGLPKHKLEMEYLGGDLYQDRGAAWYFSQFPPAPHARARGHVSVEYLADPRAPAVIHEHMPDVKLIVSLRDPVDRAISAFYWYVRKGKVPQMALEDGMRRALRAYDTHDPEQEAFRDLIERGLYAQQIERYLAFFEAGQFLVIDYENVRRSPSDVLTRITSFLGVDPAFRPRSIDTRPKLNSRIDLLTRLQRRVPESRVAGKVFDLAHQALHRVLPTTSRPTLDAALERELRSVFRTDGERLGQLFERMHQATGDLRLSWRRTST